MTTYRVCCFLRRFRAASNEPSEAVADVFQAYADGGGGVLGEDALRRFLREVQGLDAAAAEEEAREVMAFAVEQRLLKKGGLTAEGFHRWLCSDANAAIDPRRGVYQEMGLPLSHYFIYTGHNSYLTGNQLSSGCSEAPIVKALHAGVRVIELDLWPNAAKDDVEVLHGKTWTSPVELTRCLDAIKEHAFVSSPYPVILTLEDHLTPALQAKVAKLIKRTFGDMLFVSESEHMAEFPSPDDLKGKFIVSTKPPKEYLQTKSGKEDKTEGVWGEEISDGGKDSSNGHGQMSSKQSSENKDVVDAAAAEEEEEAVESEKKAQQGADDEYRRLIAIQLTRRKHDMDQDLKVDPDRVSRLSLGEKAYEKAVVTHGADIIRFTQRNLLRVFPRSTRITSSNYNPMMGWRYGVQMVAANMQGHGRKLWLTQGMFRANGGCGYVRKPDILMNPDKPFDPSSAELPVKTRLKVTVYTGDGWRFDFRQTHFDRCSPPDFYARVGIAGVAADTRMEQTRVMMDTWIPAWDHELTELPLTVPELALLRVEVHESDNHQKDEFAGQTCLPVWELRPGIRSVRLCDHKGQPLRSVKLLMRFEFLPPASSSSSSSSS